MNSLASAASILGLTLSFLIVDAHAITVTRPVNVQDVTANSATIVWNTVEAVSGSIDFGMTSDYGTSVDATVPSSTHAITLQGLMAGQLYFYRVRSAGVVLCEGPEYYFRTVPDARTSHVRFLAFGDSGKGDATQRSLVPYMVQAAPDFMIHVGDVIYPSGAAADFDPEYFVPYAPLLRHTPAWLAIGNHDDATDAAQPYLDAFYLPTNPSGTERYYSFDYGQAHFVCLDSDHPFDPVMLAWLEQDLATANATWKFAFFHHPLYSCGMHGSSTSIRHVFAPVFEAHGVDVVFNGHDHDYQRSYPMRKEAVADWAPPADSGQARGIVYVVTGGGAGTRPTSSDCSFTAFAASVTHFTLVEIWGRTLILQAIDNQGLVIDVLRIVKAPPTDAAQGAAPGSVLASLFPCRPNPFNPATELRYSLAAQARVRVAIYNLAGREVRLLFLGEAMPGEHRLTWDGRDDCGARAASGIYFARLQAGNHCDTQKLVLAK